MPILTRFCQFLPKTADFLAQIGVFKPRNSLLKDSGWICGHVDVFKSQIWSHTDDLWPFSWPFWAFWAIFGHFRPFLIVFDCVLMRFCRSKCIFASFAVFLGQFYGYWHSGAYTPVLFHENVSLMAFLPDFGLILKHFREMTQGCMRTNYKIHENGGIGQNYQQKSTKSL